MTNLFVIEGQDRAGKDTLLHDLEKMGLTIFSPDTSYLPNYHNADEFRAALKLYLEKQTNDMINLNVKDLYIARYQLSEYVYADLFNRPNLFEDYINNILKGHFKIKNIILLWDTYQDYLDRLKMINDDYIEYNEDDFNKIKNLYLKHKQPDDVVIYVKSNTTREDLITKAKQILCM